MRDFTTHPRLRVAALVVCAAGTGARGAAYVGQGSNALITYVDRFVPLHVWAGVWLTVAALICVGIWHRVVARWALSAGGALWATWAASYVAAWIVDGAIRGWVTAAAMATIAALMWIVAALVDATGPRPQFRSRDD